MLAVTLSFYLQLISNTTHNMLLINRFYFTGHTKRFLCLHEKKKIHLNTVINGRHEKYFEYQRKVLLSSFHLDSYPSGFHP